MIDIQKIAAFIEEELAAKQKVKALKEERDTYQAQYDGINKKISEIDQKIHEAHTGSKNRWKNYIESYIEEQSK